MTLVPVDLGVQPADAEQVTLTFSDHARELVLAYVDWQAQPQRKLFAGVLAFRWQELDEDGVRDDQVYEVHDSPWLTRQAALHAVPCAEHIHYMLCFNACGVLDVLCRRTVAAPGDASR